MKIPRLKWQRSDSKTEIAWLRTDQTNWEPHWVTTNKNGEHHITIPNHDPLRIGTLSSIIALVAEHFNLEKEELLRKFF